VTVGEAALGQRVAAGEVAGTAVLCGRLVAQHLAVDVARAAQVAGIGSRHAGDGVAVGEIVGVEGDTAVEHHDDLSGHAG
jgi:hypothetical protein